MVGERHAIGRALIAVFVFTCTLLAGCGQKNVEQGSRPEVEKTLGQLMRVALKYMAAHNQQLPPNEAAFKRFAQSLKKADLEELEIEDVNKIFISPRDNQPFVIRYGQSMATPTGGNTKTMGPPVFAYEKVGAGGKRWVIMLQGGSAMEVDEEALKGMVPEAK